MVFGHNSNVKFGSATFHVQTEDRGVSHALIDTTVYFQGRVLHRLTNNYFDLLPLSEDARQALKLRLDEQHRTVLEKIRSGELPLAVPPGTSAMGRAEGLSSVESMGTEPVAPAAVLAPERKLVLELLNARSWLQGRNATLHVAVKEEDGTLVQGADVSAGIEGSVGQEQYHAKTGDDGQTTISFEMPKLQMGAEAALLIRAQEKEGTGHLRYTLRAKPRVPAV